MTTITASTTIGIDLNPAIYTSPVVIGAGVTVSNAGYPYAVYRYPGATTFFIIQNDGAITSTSGGDVYLAPGGSVINAATASIIAAKDAVLITGGVGTVVNAGRIAGTGGGIILKSGGSVTNMAAASVSGSILVTGGAGTVVNDGSIMGRSNVVGVGLGTGSVTNASSGSIMGVRLAGAGTVVNEGSISAPRGVAIYSGGLLTNGASASITGYYAGFHGAAGYGVYIRGGAGTVVNYGRITGSDNGGTGPGATGGGLLAGGSVTNASFGLITGNVGVQMLAGGFLTNASSASITGSGVGVYTGGGGGTVVNDGSITGSYHGVWLRSGGSVTNLASASIMGGVRLSAGGMLTNDGLIVGGVTGVGVYLSDGTLTNAGSIVGNAGTAVTFAGTSSDLLVLDAGFGFSGIVAGGTSSSNTLELASAASVGTVTGMGSEFIHFGSIEFDAGSQWFVSGVQRGLAGPISGFAVGDTIELTGVTATGSSFVGGILTLDLVGGGSATLDLPGTFTSASDFDVTNVAAGADVTVICFAAGTHILTEFGEIKVEDLRVDDLVRTVLGETAAPIIWIGRRDVDCARHPQPRKVWPVRVATGAFGPGRPHTDLFLSPDHALYVNEVLIPVKHLINGSTIVQVPVGRVTYYHLELPQHDVVLAEGLLAETFLDMKDGSSYANRPGPAVSGFQRADVGGVRLRTAGRHGTGTGGGTCHGRGLRDGSGRRLIGTISARSVNCGDRVWTRLL